jgi:DNA-binding MarR family transcriptional regulator
MGLLASGLGISQPAATKLVERLEEKAFAQRERRSDDRRKTMIRLMPRGLQLSERLLEQRSEQLWRFFSDLGQVPRDNLVNGLEQFLQEALSEARVAQQICLRCGPYHDPDCVVNRAHLAACGKPIAP